MPSERLPNDPNRKIIEALLDLISLEGVYPSLSSGAGIPLEKRVKSVLQKGIVTRPSITVNGGPESSQLLLRICAVLGKITKHKDSGILVSIFRQRALVDFVSALVELGYSPLYGSGTQRLMYRDELVELIDRYLSSSGIYMCC